MIIRMKHITNEELINKQISFWDEDFYDPEEEVSVSLEVEVIDISELTLNHSILESYNDESYDTFPVEKLYKVYINLSNFIESSKANNSDVVTVLRKELEEATEAAKKAEIEKEEAQKEKNDAEIKAEQAKTNASIVPED